MGWRGALRSVAAAARAAERESQRRYRQQQREQLIADSAAAVEDWESHINGLVSLHQDVIDLIDWHAVAERTCPHEPEQRRERQERAEAALARFKPRFFHAIRGGSEKLRGRLEAEVEKARQLDEQQYKDELAAHAKDVAEWNEDTSLAKKLIQGDAAAMRQVIEEMQSRTENALIGTAIGFLIDNNYVHACPKVHGDDIIPTMRRKQLASGRLSETKMPVGQFNELYQDYVASVALKTASDLLQILPLDEVYVTCEANLLNTQSGHREWTPVLSVQVVRDTFADLNLAMLDPSDAVRNFRHNTAFSKTKGFSAIASLKPVYT